MEASKKKHKFVVVWKHRMGLYGPGYMPTGLCGTCGRTYLEPIHKVSRHGGKLDKPKTIRKTASHEKPWIKVIFKIFNYELWVVKRNR